MTQTVDDGHIEFIKRENGGTKITKNKNNGNGDFLYLLCLLDDGEKKNEDETGLQLHVYVLCLCVFIYAALIATGHQHQPICAPFACVSLPDYLIQVDVKCAT